MSVPVAVIILLEVLCLLFIVWGFEHEDKLIRFETKIGLRKGAEKEKEATANGGEDI